MENETLKQASSMLNQLSKQHQKAKDLLSEASHDFALLKAILKYEKKTTTRPEEIYLENVKKRLDENLAKLNEVYGKKLSVPIKGSIGVTDLIYWLNNESSETGDVQEILNWIIDNKVN